MTSQTTMRAVQGKDYGDIDEMLSVEDNIRVPSLEDLPSKKRKHYIKIKTLAVALAPGDVRVLSGKTRELQGPPSMPYVPGGDVCGIVVDAGETEFKVGDKVAARFVEKPMGCLGEYAVVHARVCDVVPTTMSCTEAAALISASPATLLAKRILPDEKVLVVGAGGGIGSHVIQLIKPVASKIVGVGSDPERLLKPPIACDEVVDYTKDNVWTLPEYQKQKFDVIIDLVGGGWLRLLETSKKKQMICKTASEGGRYLTMTPDKATFEAHSIWQVLNIFLWPSLWRAIKSRLWARRSLPKYTFAMSLDDTKSVATETLELGASQKMKACMDQLYPFTTKGVRAAFRKQESRHAKGKVVVQVSKE